MTRPVVGLLMVFLPLSFFTIGGGQAVIAEVQRQVVTVHHWMSKTEFANLFAISRMAPGPGSLYITLVGWYVAGVAGAIAATIGIFVPTIALTYVISGFWKPHAKADWQRALETGLKPVAAGMVLASVFVLFMNLNGGSWARAIAVASTGLLSLTRINPLIVLGSGALLFLLLHHFQLATA